MSDMFDEMLSGMPNNISVKKLKTIKKVTDPVLYSSGAVDITFMVDKILTKREIDLLRNLIERNNIKNYQILYPLTVEDSFEDKTATWRKWVNYSIDLTEFIPRGTKIVSFGKCIFSITKCDDLDCTKVVEEDSDTTDKKVEKNSIIQGFYDTILWNTSFYDNRTKTKVFPVDSWTDLLSKKTGIFGTNFEMSFLRKQIKLCRDTHFVIPKIRKLNLVYVENPNEWLLERTSDKVEIAIDTETNGLDPWSPKGKVHCIQISYDGYTGYYLSADKVDNNILSEYLKDRPLIMTNGKFDIKWLNLKMNIPLDNMYIISDTILLQQICNEMMRKGLKTGAFLYTPYGGYDKELDDYLESHPELNDNYSLIPFETLFKYSTTDPCITYQVNKSLLDYRNKLDELLNSDNKYGYSLKYCYDEIMIPALNNSIEMELIGIPVDKEVLRETSEQTQKDIIAMREEIKNILGADNSFNINSNDDLGKKLEEYGLPIIDRNQKGIANVGDAQLQSWSKDGYEIADKILKYKEISKNFSTFIGMEHIEDFGKFSDTTSFDMDSFFFEEDNKKLKKKGPTGLYKYIKSDGRIHGNFALFSTQSLRSRSFAMNLQQIPAHGEKAKIARKPFRPIDKNHVFLSTDLSGIQLRIGAILSGDKNMYRTFQELGGNLHLMTASSYIPYFVPEAQTFEQMLSILEDETNPNSEVIKELRYKAKGINFLCEFNGSALVLAQQNVIPEWDTKSKDAYIKANKLSYKDLLVKTLREGSNLCPLGMKADKVEDYVKGYIIADDLVKKFFNTYSGLRRWEDETMKLAQEQGYIVTVHGCIRRLPYLLVSKEGNDDVNGMKFHNLCNISLNTQAQNFESLWIQRAFVNIKKECKEKNLWGKDHNMIFGTIHDAGEFYSNRDELKDFVSIVHKWYCKDYPEAEGIPVECESNYADTYVNGELWDMGTKIKP